MKTKRQYLCNALLLTAVTLLMRTVSVSFNVYVSNRVGAEAMGLLSLVSGVYGFAVTLATSGIHLATVRTVSERLEQLGHCGVHHVPLLLYEADGQILQGGQALQRGAKGRGLLEAHQTPDENARAAG